MLRSSRSGRFVIATGRDASSSSGWSRPVSPRTSASETLDGLTDSGLLSDDRFAAERARGLAARNGSDLLIRADLGRHGIAGDVVAEVMAELEPEGERAARIFQQRGGGDRALRYLSGKGFTRDSLEILSDADPVH